MHPILLHIGDFPLHWYGVLIAIGAVLAVYITDRWGDQAGLPKNTFGDLGFWSILLGIGGARLWYVVQHWQEFDTIGQMVNIRSGGLVSYGGLLGVFLAFAIVILRRKLPTLTVLDILAPAIPLGHMFGRMGCMMAGCCHGRPSDLPWAVTFTDPASSVQADLLGVPLHPTQLYAVIYLGALAGFLFWYRGRKRFEGELFLIYLTAYPLLRSINEIFRGDSVRGYLIDGWVTTGQAMSGIVAVLAVIGWVWMGKVNKQHQERKAKAAQREADQDAEAESSEAESQPSESAE